MSEQEDIITVRELILDPICSGIEIINIFPPVPRKDAGYVFDMMHINYNGGVYWKYNNAWEQIDVLSSDSKINNLIKKVGIYRAAKILLLQQIDIVGSSSESSSTGGLASANIGSISVSFDNSANMTAEQKIALWKEKLAALDEIIALLSGDPLFGGFYSFCKRPIGGIVEYD